MRSTGLHQSAASAIRKLAAEAAENGLLDRSVAQGIVSLKGVRHSGDRAGNWLTREQARDLLAQPAIEPEGKRDRSILAVLLGCALRRSELAALDGEYIQQLTDGMHRIRVSYFQGPRDGVALILEVALPGERYRIFNTKDFLPANAEGWKSNDAEASDPPASKRKK